MLSIFRNKRLGSFAIIAGLLIPTQVISSAHADDFTFRNDATSSVTYTGNAIISGNVSVSQEFQLTQPTSNINAGNGLMWAMHVTSGDGGILGDLSWTYFDGQPVQFTFSMAGASDVDNGTSGAICTKTPAVYCYNNSGNFNFSDPFRLNFGTDTSKGSSWWTFTITDLKNNATFTAGSLKVAYPVGPSKVTVTDSILPASLITFCVGDAMPVADSYFGPVIDSNGTADLVPSTPVAPAKCVNTAQPKLTNYVGAYMLYGGTPNSQQTSPRSDPFQPSSLLPSAVPPTPDTPTNFQQSIKNGVLTLSVSEPTGSSKGVNSIYMTAPEIGYTDSNAVGLNIQKSDAHIDIPILPGFVDKPIYVSIYAKNSWMTSTPFTTTLTIPSSALTPVKLPSAQPSTSAPAAPNVSSAPASVTKLPSAIKTVSARVQSGHLVISGATGQSVNSEAVGALLVSSALGFTSDSPSRAFVSGGKYSFSVKLNKAMSGKTVAYSIYLYNKLGVSKPYSAKVKLP